VEPKTLLGKVLLDIRNRAIKKGLKLMIEEEVLDGGEINLRDDKYVAKCSFCGKTGREVEYLVAGPYVYICDKCVEFACRFIDERRRRRQKKDYVTRVLESKEEQNGTNN